MEGQNYWMKQILNKETIKIQYFHNFKLLLGSDEAIILFDGVYIFHF